MWQSCNQWNVFLLLYQSVLPSFYKFLEMHIFSADDTDSEWHYTVKILI